MNAESPLVFHRRRIAAVSGAIGGWHRCPRAACRRAGQCKGVSDILPACLPTVTRSVMDSFAECLTALPNAEPRPPSRARQLEESIMDIEFRASAMMSRMLARMEKKERAKYGDGR